MTASVIPFKRISTRIGGSRRWVVPIVMAAGLSLFTLLACLGGVVYRAAPQCQPQEADAEPPAVVPGDPSERI